jgi:exodeoxyribonuclease-3
MRLVAFNVNGIRALDRKGGVDRLVSLGADVVCVQEVRATSEQLSEALAGRVKLATFAESNQRGRNGAALLSDLSPLETRTGLPGFADEGRWAEALFDVSGEPIRVISVYVPTGQVGESRQDRKMDFLARMTERMAELQEAAVAGGAQVLVCGDLNVARTDADLKNWRGNRGRSGVLPEEREVLERWADSGWVDVSRRLAGDVVGPYTWWSQRGRAFDNDAGWRIDYVWCTTPLAQRAESSFVDRAPAWDARWSDHAAVVVDFK